MTRRRRTRRPSPVVAALRRRRELPILAALAVAALAALASPLVGAIPAPWAPAPPPAIRLDELTRAIAAGDVSDLSLPASGGRAVATLRDGRVASVATPFDEGELARRAVASGARVTVDAAATGGVGPWDLASNLLPVALLGALALGAWRRGVQGGFEYLPRGSFEAGFDDVAGAAEAKDALREAVAHMRDPVAYGRLGAPAPRGLLLVGPPGGGKTLLAGALAREAGVGMVHVKGGEVSGLIVGAGARRVSAIFREARRRAPCVLFVDEFDALAPRRSAGVGSGASEDVRTVSQLLVELQGVADREGVFVLGATNRPEAIDPAVLRRGRVDAVVEVPPLDAAGRRAALALGARELPLEAGVDLDALSRATPGLSGADVAALLAEAARAATRRGADGVGRDDVDEALRRVRSGRPRDDVALSTEDAEVVCFHEAGHALASCLVPGADPVLEATVAPRGASLGRVVAAPPPEALLLRRRVLDARVSVLLAGRAAELATFGPDDVTDGAYSDLKAAIRLLDEAVSRFGLVGGFDVSLDVVAAEGRPTGDAALALRDAEVARRVSAAGLAMVGLMEREAVALGALAGVLRERRTLSGDEVRSIVAAHRAAPVAVAAE